MMIRLIRRLTESLDDYKARLVARRIFRQEQRSERYHARVRRYLAEFRAAGGKETRASVR